MLAAKQRVYNIIETLSDSQLTEIINFMLFIKMREKNEFFGDLESVSVSSTDFWDNAIDNEVWNDA